MRNLLFIVLISLLGLGVLVSLGMWQMQRLAWKEGLIAAADQMMQAPPVALPQRPQMAEDRYRPVAVSGQFTGEELFVLTSTREMGPGYRVIEAFVTDEGRRILVDRGFIKQENRDLPRPGGPAAFSGNLNWPDDMTAGTPAPDVAANLWFGRDVEAMSQVLATEPVMVIASSPTGSGISAMPATAAFKNDHLGYALTWFGLAVVWAGMTLGYVWRIRSRKA